MRDEKAIIRDQIQARIREFLENPRTDRLAQGERVAGHLSKDESFSSAATVALFASLPDEIETSPIFELCQRNHKRAVYPSIVQSGHGLDFFERRQNGPQRGDLAVEEIDLFLIPGVAFTAGGKRLGRGGGFYDRTLSRPEFSHVPRFGIGFDCQMVDELPVLDHDVHCHKVFTPERVFEGPLWRAFIERKIS